MGEREGGGEKGGLHLRRGCGMRALIERALQNPWYAAFLRLSHTFEDASLCSKDLSPLTSRASPAHSLD
jgi:hypothetical protein